MTPERWRLVKDIFDAALHRPAAERAAFLAVACGEDQALRARVERMLEVDARDSVVLDKTLGGVVSQLLTVEDNESLIGRLFGPYRLEREIGRGGMGRVYLARDTRLDRPVALKLLPQAFSDNPERVRRFQQEARVVSALNHPNIITIHEIGESEGLRFIVTEFVAGDTLAHIIARGDRELASLLKIILQVTEALEAAHGAGIVHRDIKPENIMVRPDGYVKVLDFGIAKLSQAPDVSGNNFDQVVTSPGLVLGTVKYMSPEQARGHQVDARTDIFSLGIVLYEAVTGHDPFPAKTRSDVLIAIAAQEPAPLADFVPTAPSLLQQIVDRALRKKRDERYQTMAQLRYDLETLTDSVLGHSRNRTSLTTAAVAGRATSTAEYVVKEVRRHKLFAAVALAAAFVIVAVLINYFNSLNAKRIDSIAVLPFSYSGTNPHASVDDDSEYLSDGLTEGLINGLSQMPGLKVIARSSVFRYKGKDLDSQATARALSVSKILTGRIVQRGENLQVSVELIDAGKNTQLWGHHYDLAASDMARLQRDIVGRVSESLHLSLTDEDQKRLAKRYTENSEAYQLYLQGRFFWNKRTESDIKRSIEYYQQAIAKDNGYALAYAGLASSYALASEYGAMQADEAARNTRDAALRALQLDDRMAEAYAALALTMSSYDWDQPGAEREFKRAIETDANSATGHHWYAIFLTQQGRFAEGLREAQKARELDPISISINTQLGAVYYYSRQYEQAIQQFHKALELNTNAAGTRAHLGMAYEQAGHYAEAIAEFQKAAILGNVHAEYRMAHTYAISGQRAKARQLLDEEAAKEKADRPVSDLQYLRATVYAGMGEKDAAFAALDALVKTRDSSLVLIKVDPALDNLRSDPRFQSLLERVGLTH